jgi:hypothetical protein
MTMQSRAQIVHPANPAEVIAIVACQVLSLHQSRYRSPSSAVLGTTLPGKYCQSTLPPGTGFPNNRASGH